ncbi:MAG: porin family protein [Ignavibacterium sp.]|nr:porin family protein [Ignavibacterium sp.]MDW8374550.1 outer membrane beta-barrel protein [Ignavibacteriales bacterium]
MKKLFSVLFLVLFALTFANAQSKMAVGVGGNLALPMGSFGDVAGMGFGGGAQFEYSFAPNIVGTVSATYLMFGEKELSGFGKYSYSIIPIHAGAKYLFGNFYTSAETGMNMISLKVDIPARRIGTVTIPGASSTSSTSEFGFAVGAGYILQMGKNALDLSVKYQNYASSTAAINVGVAYKFGF